MIIRNNFVKSIDNQVEDHLFPVKGQLLTPQLNYDNYYRDNELTDIFFSPTLPIRYVNYLSGSDSNNGLTPATAWKKVTPHRSEGEFIYLILSPYIDDGLDTNESYRAILVGYNQRVLWNIKNSGGDAYVNCIQAINIDFNGYYINSPNKIYCNIYKCNSTTFYLYSNGFYFTYFPMVEYCYLKVADIPLHEYVIIKNSFFDCWQLDLELSGVICQIFFRVNSITFYRTYMQNIYNNIIIEGAFNQESFFFNTSVLLKGIFSGDRDKVLQLVETNRIEFDADFWNITQPDFQIRCKTLTFADIPHTFSLELTNWHLGPELSFVNRFDYIDDTDSERQISNRINTNIVLTTNLERSQFERIRYSLKKSTYFIVSAYDRMIEIQKGRTPSEALIYMDIDQDGYYFKLEGESEAELYRWEGYIGEVVRYDSEEAEGEHVEWIYIDSTVKVGDVWLYRFKTINLPSETYRIDNRYKNGPVGSYPLFVCRFAYKIYTLYDFKYNSDLGDGELVELEFVFSEKHFDSPKNNLLLTMKNAITNKP